MNSPAGAPSTPMVRRPLPGRLAVGATTSDIPAVGGLQRFTVEILSELMGMGEDVVGFAASPAVRDALGERVRLVSPRMIAEGNLQGNLARLLWHQAALPAAVRREGATLFYSTIPDGMLFPPCPQVITIHDLIPLRFPASSPRLRQYFRFVVPRLIAASRAVVAMSEATRRDIIELYGVDEDRVHVAYQGYRADLFRPVSGPEVARMRERYGLRDYLLSVGEGRPYKNMTRLLEAFARLNSSSVQLAMVGKQNRRECDLRALALSLGVGDRVKFLDFVPDAELPALYGGASAFVFPSLYEGFGIPLLEAMACGCPVVTSAAASMPEVCGEAAIYVDPEDVDDLAGAITRVLADAGLRAELRGKGLRRAAGFSYRAAAERILEILRLCAS